MCISNHEPLVSIIVPVFRVEEYLDVCIRSIREQTYENLEIILVDDGSPDLCPQMCDSYAAQDNRIRVIHKENSGVSAARETGIEAATGEFLMFVDGDDWIDTETIASCVNVAIHDKADCVLFSYLREYGDRSIPTNLFEHDANYDMQMAEQQIHRRLLGPTGSELRHPQALDRFSSMWSKLYTSSVARKGKIVSERLIGTSEDTIFNLYALDGCKSITCINRNYYHYRKTNFNSITSCYKQDLPEKWDILYQIFREYINESTFKEIYEQAFYNRVACGIIGLGLNEISAPVSFSKRVKAIKRTMQKPLYRDAFQRLDITECSLEWKVFFLLCKYDQTFLLTCLLIIINYLRSKIAE